MSWIPIRVIINNPWFRGVVFKRSECAPVKKKDQELVSLFEDEAFRIVSQMG